MCAFISILTSHAKTKNYSSEQMRYGNSICEALKCCGIYCSCTQGIGGERKLKKKPLKGFILSTERD